MKITRFEDLDCWQAARILVQHIYNLARNRGFQNDFRLAGQIEAAAISVMANIAEGFVRRSDKEFGQFLFIAMSSVAEVQSHLYVALDLEYVSEEQFKTTYLHADKTARMISALIKYLRADRAPSESTHRTSRTKSTR